MDADEITPPRGFRLRDALLHGAEPPPAGFIVRQPWYPWLIVGVTCIGAFIGQVDASIVQLALPQLGQVFHAKLDAVSWVSLAYLLAFASFLPIFGRLCAMFGRKLMYLLGYLVFTVASMVCGFAPDLTSPVAFRVLQGVGGAMLGANSISILVKAVDQSRRARAMGYFAAAQAIGVSAGPAVGGLLLGAFGWRWIFWVVVPFGIAAAGLGWLALPQTAGPSRDKRFDWYGALLLTPALTALVLVLNEISAWGAASPALLGCVATAVVLMALFVRLERASAIPLVDLRLFRQAAFTRGSIGVVAGYAMLYGMFFVMSFALVRGYHDSSELAGYASPFFRSPWVSSRLSAAGSATAWERGFSAWPAWQFAWPRWLYSRSLSPTPPSAVLPASRHWRCSAPASACSSPPTTMPPSKPRQQTFLAKPGRCST